VANPGSSAAALNNISALNDKTLYQDDAVHRLIIDTDKGYARRNITAVTLSKSNE